MANELQGRKIAILLAPAGTEQPEFTEPRKAVQNAGASVEVIGAQTGTVQTVNHDLKPGESFRVDQSFAQAAPDDYDGLIIPGGAVGADKLRGNQEAVRFVRSFFEQAKPVAVICHGPWLLVEADVVRGCRLASYPTLQTDIRNAGGTWLDQEVVTDNGLVTSRRPDGLPAFCAKLVEEFAEGKHAAQARNV